MNYFGQWPDLPLIRQNGDIALAADVLSDVAYVILLFGASWSPECSSFQPLLSRFNELHHKKKRFAVVYISRDDTKSALMNGFLLHCLEAAAQKRERRLAERMSRRASCTAAVIKPVTTTSAASSFSSAMAEERSGSTERTTIATGAAAAASSSSSHSLAGKGGAADSSTASFPSGGYWAVPFEYTDIVGVPLLYHLRIRTYPSVVVCANHPPPTAAALQVLPAVARPALVAWHPPHGSVQYLRGAGPVEAPRPRPPASGVIPRECCPDVVTIAGRFMITQADPAGESFPWASMGRGMRHAAIVFFSLVVGCLVVILPKLLPLVIHRQAKEDSLVD